MEWIPPPLSQHKNCSLGLPCNFQRQARIVMIMVALRDFEVLSVFYCLEHREKKKNMLTGSHGRELNPNEIGT
jgi:hypothetical protein